MFWPATQEQLQAGRFAFFKTNRLLPSVLWLWLMASVRVCCADNLPLRTTEGSMAAKFDLCVTNVAQFRSLSRAEHLAGCNFHLTGVVTLVDASRDLVVLQDDSGAVALNFRLANQGLQAGQLVTVDGTNCSPLFSSFPDYPYRPSGQNICPSFATPSFWGQYYLTRMRGCLHPQVTGNYRFWTASDNSSELWLSTDADLAKARKIASIPRFEFVQPPAWTQYPSQRSELIELKAGGTYYIEALQEQTTGGDYLSVGWQPPGESAISIIDGHYLTPWDEDHHAASTATNGILREYWTNYYDGDLAGLAGTRPFASALTVKAVGLRIHGLGALPKPVRIALNQELLSEDNYRWVQAEGVLKFVATDGDTALLELAAGPALLQVRALHWSPDLPEHLTNVLIRVEGVCEPVYDQTTLRPGLIWAPSKNGISFIAAGPTNAGPPAGESPILSTISTNSAMQGFYSCRGVVTFNERVFDQHYIFVQQDDTPVRVNQENSSIKSQFQVGQEVDLGGALEPGKYLPVITPLVVTKHGLHAMPVPIFQPLGLADSANREGKWNELEGIVRSVNTNGTLTIVGKDGSACLWIGQTPSDYLARYVDAKISARGVLLLSLLEVPLLLVPSRHFVEVEEAAPDHPFDIRRRFIGDLLAPGVESEYPHRVRVLGQVTWRDARSFFVQDESGGIRVRTSGQPEIAAGASVEVIAFPTPTGATRTLTEALVLPANSTGPIASIDLDLNETLASRLSGTLVNVSAVLLAQKTNSSNQVLVLQEQQRVFVATLANRQGILPDMVPGSRLRVTGVCDGDTDASPLIGGKPPSAQFLTSINILLRRPQDVAVLGGPPWWTWRKTATLVGMLVTILAVTLLWVHLLHRRLERQKAAQLAFSRQVLERLEDERRRIAVNLHDSLGQTLLVIKNHAILAIQRPPEELGLRHRLDEISGATSQAIEEVRLITHGLRPYQLDRLGLTQAIRASVSRASANSSIIFASRVKDIDNLFDKDAEIHVYRIVQEAVTNVVKHSAATEATVVIMQRTTVVSLSIRDNGRGFDPAKPSPESHDLGYGLSGIAERVRILGGTLAIESRTAEGTSLNIDVPLPILKA